MAAVHIALGSNIAPEENLTAAVGLLRERMTLTGASPVFRTPPWGVTDQPDFLNAVVAANTALAPTELLDALQAIEQARHRERTLRNGPRTLDLDLLLYGNLVLAGERLTVPHPRLHQRGFVLVPLCALAPELPHPVLGATMSRLLAVVNAGGIAEVSFRLPEG